MAQRLEGETPGSSQLGIFIGGSAAQEQAVLKQAHTPFTGSSSSMLEAFAVTANPTAYTNGGAHLPLHQLPPPPVAPAPNPAAIKPVGLMFPPADVYRSFQATAEARMSTDYFTLAAMGLAAGFYISFAFTFCCCATGSTGQILAGALAFPTGLLLIVLCGGDLYTGNTCSMFTANIEGKANAWHHIKHTAGTYFWNLVGCLIVIGLQRGAGVWKGREDWVHNFAHKKVGLEWGEVLCRAILANWLVNLALWQAACARDVLGKAIGCWTPICAFVCIGLEHVVANMYIIPMSIYLPPTEHWPKSITWATFIRRNIIPATIGNWIGGAIMVGTLHACIYGNNIPKWKNRAWEATLGRFIKRLP